MYDQLRPLGYPNTDCVIMLYSAVNYPSFSNLAEKWIPEIERHLPRVPILLACNQIDIREDPLTLDKLARLGQKPVSKREADRFFASYCKQKKSSFQQIVESHEISALTGVGLRELFESAFFHAYQNKFNNKKKDRSGCSIL